MLVEHGGPSPGQSLHGGEPVGPGRSHRLRETGVDPIGSAEGNHRPGDVEPQDISDLTPGDGGELRMADCGVHCRVIRIGGGDQGETLHNQEDKEPGVTVSGTVIVFARVPMGTVGSAGFVDMNNEGSSDLGGHLRNQARTAAVVAAVSLLTACGDAPFASLGERSSGWIGEPTVVTTTTVATTVPIVVGAEVLKWFNDGLGGEFLDDAEALKVAVFARRGGDLFIQASRAEIAILLPDVKFPTSTPYLSEYVTSQLVFDETGELEEDPVAAFGIWSSEPYTRSRSVAQMIIMQVSADAVTAADVAAPGADNSCERFADRSTEVCAVSTIGDRPVWALEASNGTTMIWWDGDYRYELFGRSYVAPAALEEMASGLVPLSELETAPG